MKEKTIDQLKNELAELNKRIAELEKSENHLKQDLEFSNAERVQLASIFYSIDEPIYISTPDTYKVLYANQASHKIFGVSVGRLCYEVFHGFKSPCPFCTNEHIFGKNLGKTYIWECQNQINKRWYRCVDKAIRWPGGRMVRYEVAIDINDRKSSEEALHESEERYRTVIEQSADCIYLADVETKRILEANQAFQRLLGYSPDEIRKLSVYDFVSNNRENINEKIQQILTGRGYFKGERCYRRRDGTIVDVEVSVSLISYRGRNVFCGIARDITERKQAQEALHKSERFLNTIFDSINDPFNIIDRDYRIIKANEPYARMRGKTIEQILGKRCYEVLQNRMSVCEGCTVKETFNTGKPYTKEKLSNYLGHEQTWLEIYTYPLFDETGNVVNVIEYTRDITKRKTTEEALLENEKKYRALFQDSRDAIYLTTRDGRFVEVNQSMLDLFGYTKEEMMKLDAKQMYFNPADRAKFKQEIEQKGSVKNYEVKLRKKDGTILDCLLTSATWDANNGITQGYQGIIHDITKRKKFE